jgi:hypothetical protein
MKTPLSQRIAFGLACVTALGLGISLRAKERKLNNGTASASVLARPGGAAPREVSSWDAGSALNERIALRRAIAKCDDASLWAWLAVPTDEVEALELVIDELIDRSGWDAWRHVIEMERGNTRVSLAARFLAEFAERDPWKAYEEWKKARGSFDDSVQVDFGSYEGSDWADSAFYGISKAAAATSAEKLIEVMRVMRRDTEGFHHEVEVKFAAGFDFAPVMEFLAAGPERPFLVPKEILLEWAKRSPDRAAEWWGSHSDFRLGREEPARVYAAIAGSESGARSLASLDFFSPEQVEEAWWLIGMGSKGAVNANLLDTATQLGRREDYLVRVLMDSRMREGVDASWNQVPLDERMRVKDKAWARWSKANHSPVDLRAKERWTKILDKAWQ